MAESIVVVFIMLLLVLFLILLACKPWRFFSRSYLPLSIKDDDLERPLAQEESDQLLNPSHEPSSNSFLEGSQMQTEGRFTSHGAQSLKYKHRLPPRIPHLTQGDSLTIDIGDMGEDLLVGQTLKRPLSTSHILEEQKHTLKKGPYRESRSRPDEVEVHRIFGDILDQGTCLSLEVIKGPARGLQCSLLSSDVSKLPLTLGRVPPSNLLLKDSEVSGKHAMINWNSDKMKWELVDMGSLNGTLLNAKAIHHPDFGSRTWGEPEELLSGDIITLGTTSQIRVQITLTESEVSFGVGIASDPMSTRRGGKKLPMEDVCYYRCPLPGIEQFGLFGICDGHGGAVAAQSVSKILPENVSTILLDSLRRERVLSRQDASDVLREAFYQTEACLNHYYEGCTATLLLIWGDGYDSFFAQCANVGDSACVMNVNGKQINMTEDHRISSYSEKQRVKEMGYPLKDEDTRLCGLNLGRMLGDKFLKEQDARFSSEPYISQAVRIGQPSEAFAILASDGLWDVISAKKASQLVLEAKETYSADRKDSAQKIAEFLLDKAKKSLTKDNTSIVYVDCDIALRTLCKYDS
ncbi:unnamed protein product [Amaranthus hypochondriacus]